MARPARIHAHELRLYTQLRLRPDNNHAPTAGPIQSPPLDLHASPHVDTIARKFVGDDGIRMAAAVTEA